MIQVALLQNINCSVNGIYEYKPCVIGLQDASDVDKLADCKLIKRYFIICMIILFLCVVSSLLELLVFFLMFASFMKEKFGQDEVQQET